MFGLSRVLVVLIVLVASDTFGSVVVVVDSIFSGPNVSAMAGVLSIFLLDLFAYSFGLAFGLFRTGLIFVLGFGLVEVSGFCTFLGAYDFAGLVFLGSGSDSQYSFGSCGRDSMIVRGCND